MIGGGVSVAYVLAGGKSSRFRSDKARAVLAGTPLIVRVADVLRQVCGEVIAVADASGKYADLGLPTIADRRPGLGPLAGVEAALADRIERHGRGFAIFASCDLAGLRAEWLDEIVSFIDPARADSDHLAIAFREEFWQPFPGAYHSDLLPVVSELLDVGRASFQRLLADPRARALGLPLPADWPAVPQVNTREDLERFQGEPPRHQEHQGY